MSFLNTQILIEYTDPDRIQTFSIGPITLTINAGETLFITGGNGSGKSTFIKILTGLYSPKSGTVSINGQTISLSDHRYLFSAVFSDFHLFEALYGTDILDENWIKEMLYQMELEDKLSFSNGRFSHLNLSAGQRRRLALIAALSEGRQIIVLDEWAADQGPRFRQYFYEELLPALKRGGKTVVAVTHDDNFYHTADRIITMKDGKIVEKCQYIKKNLTNPSEIRTVEHSFFFANQFTQNTTDESVNEQSTDSHKFGQNDYHRDKHIIPTLSQILPFFTKIGFLFISNSICIISVMIIISKTSSQCSGTSKVQYFFLFVILLLLIFFITRLTERTVSKTLEHIIGNIRAAIINRTRKIELSFFEKIGAARIYTSLSSDMKTLTDVATILISSFDYNIRLIFVIAYFAFLAFPVFLIGLCLSGFIAILLIQNQFRLKESLGRLRKGEIDFFKSMTDLLSGFKELRLNDQKNDAFFHKHLKVICRRVSLLRLNVSKYMMLNILIVYGFWNFVMAMLPLIYPFIGISAHTLLMCVAIISYLPINALVLFIPPLTLGIESGRRVKELIQILDKAEQDSVCEISEKEKIDFKELRCKDMIFRYPNLDGNYEFSTGTMNINISAGELIYITGGNGSGKSTLIKLITGLYTPSSGQILLNGHPVDIRQHRYLFSVIFSDFHLFDSLYGIFTPDEKRVNEIIHLMQLQKKVKYADGKFTTTKLSIGQKKRLALVIAMMENRDVYIFDEWAAEQDPHFRSYFYESLLPGFRAEGKTVIAVTHHDQYFQLADRVLKMEYGRII